MTEISTGRKKVRGKYRYRVDTTWYDTPEQATAAYNKIQKSQQIKKAQAEEKALKVKAVLPGAASESTFSDSTKYKQALANKEEGMLKSSRDDLVKVKNDIFNLTANARATGMSRQDKQLLEILRADEKLLTHKVGIDTTGFSADASIPQEKSFFSKIAGAFGPSDEGTWKRQRRTELMRAGEVLDEDIPAGFSKYEHVKNLVEQEWESRKNPSDMSNDELLKKVSQ